MSDQKIFSKGLTYNAFDNLHLPYEEHKDQIGTHCGKDYHTNPFPVQTSDMGMNPMEKMDKRL